MGEAPDNPDKPSDAPGPGGNLGDQPMRAPWLKDGKPKPVEVPSIHRSGGRTAEGSNSPAAGAGARFADAIAENAAKAAGASVGEAASMDSRTAPAGQPLAFEFSGTTGEYFRIWAVNICLTILTLGFYSAWAKVRNLRYFYGSTRVAGSAFDYHANPYAILKGRAIVAIYLLAWGTIGKLMPLMELAFWLVTAALIPWAVVRGRMFHLGNSSWRNIRMGFDGEYRQALKIFVGLPILMPLTLGLIYPYFQSRRYNFLIGNSRLGDSGFDIDIPWKAFLKPYFVSGMIVAAAFAVIAIGGFLLGPGLTSVGGEAGKLFLMGLTVVLMGAAYAFSGACIQARFGNLVWNGTTLGRNTFKSTLGTRDLAMLYITNTLAIAFTVGLAIPWAKVRTVRYRLGHLVLIPAGDLDAFVAATVSMPGALGDELGEGLDLDLGL